MSTLRKDCKQTYFSAYLKENIKDRKKTGKALDQFNLWKVKTVTFPHLFLTMASVLQNLQLWQKYLMIFFDSVAPAI